MDLLQCDLECHGGVLDIDNWNRFFAYELFPIGFGIKNSPKASRIVTHSGTPV